MFEDEYENAEDIPAAVKHLYTEVDGVHKILSVTQLRSQGDSARLTESLRKERNDHKVTKQKFAAFGDRDPEEILADLDKIDEYKQAAAGKLDDTAINTMVESRITARMAPLERKLTAAEQAVQEKENIITAFQASDNERLIKDHMRESAQAAKVRPLNMDDALDFGLRVLQVVEDDTGTKSVVTRDNIGVTPGIDPSELLVEMQGKRAWWDDSIGAGARGSNGKGAVGGPNPFTHENWNMGSQGKLINTDRKRAEALAKAAGTTIGGGRPKPAEK